MTSLHILKVLSLLVPAALLAGCLPFPHRATVSPAIVGKVHRNERPIENVAVYIENGVGPCSFKSTVLTRSDGEGEFRFQPRKKFRFFIVMDPYYSLRICIAEGNQHYEGWKEAGLGFPTDMTLDCDLEKAPGTGICSAKSQVKTKRKRD